MKRKIVLYTKWNKRELECACNFFNPLCEKYKQCEEIEVVLDPYADIEEVMNERRYVRHKGALRQK